MNHDPTSDYRSMCKYGSNCFQTNPMHTEKFRHPEAEKKKEEPEEKGDDNPDSKEGEPEAKRQKTADDKENAVPTPIAATAQVDSLPAPPEDVKVSIKQKFLVDMPEDFYLFWEFCREKLPSHPEDALLATCGLKLVGPFEVLSGKLLRSHNSKAEDYLLHWRYYFDTPEFMTVISNPETDFHIGYFRDDPNEAPSLVASNDATDCKLTMMGDNLFAAVFNHIARVLKDADPFKQTALTKLKESIHVYANMKLVDHDLGLEVKTRRMKARDKLKVSSTFHGAGMVVPFDKDTQVGYREIPETSAALKKIFKDVVEAESKEEKDRAGDVLQELITNVQFANDEGDPGMGLELGLDAFCFGGEKLHPYVEHLLGVAYELVKREQFAAIALAHLKRRCRNGCFTIQ